MKGLGLRSLGFGVWRLVFGVWRSVFGGWLLVLGFWFLVFGVHDSWSMIRISGFKVQGPGVQGSECRGHGSGLRAQGSECMGAGFVV